MTGIGNIPYFEIPIDKSGNPVDPESVEHISRYLETQGSPARDLFVMSHGWNSNMSDARGLYESFFSQFRRTLDEHAAPGIAVGHCVIAGILWPSERFTDPALIPGGAASLGFTGVRDTASMLLNLATFHRMKERAGTVGRGGVAESLNRLQAAFPRVRIHLAGHSFGCRVITAAAAVVAKPVASMMLFQAAFSHNAFSPDFDSTHRPGAFRGVVTGRKFRGPMLISHSIRDEAVGLGYPIASRLRGDRASSLGGVNDVYGGLGRTGALHTPEASDGELLEAGAPYSFAPGRIFNLRADDIIASHCDIVKPETAWALIAAASSTLV